MSIEVDDIVRHIYTDRIFKVVRVIPNGSNIYYDLVSTTEYVYHIEPIFITKVEDV